MPAGRYHVERRELISELFRIYDAPPLPAPPLEDEWKGVKFAIVGNILNPPD